MKKNLMNLIMSCAHVDIHGFPTQFIISKVQQYSLNCMEPFTATDLKKKITSLCHFTRYIFLNCDLFPFSGIPHFTPSDVNMEAEIKSIIDRKPSLGKSQCLLLDYAAVIWSRFFIPCFSYLGNSSGQ